MTRSDQVSFWFSGPGTRFGCAQRPTPSSCSSAAPNGFCLVEDVARMRVRRWSGALAGFPFACIVGYMAAHAVPEPPRRPADIQANQPPPKSSSTVPAQEAPAKPSTPPRAGSTLDPEQAIAESATCVARLERLGLRIELVTLGAEKNDACVIEIPVRLTLP